jgi:hypothetical protein
MICDGEPMQECRAFMRIIYEVLTEDPEPNKRFLVKRAIKIGLNS